MHLVRPVDDAQGAGGGVGEAEAEIVRDARRAVRLDRLPLPFRTPTLDLYLYWHASVAGDAANGRLRAPIVEAFREVS